MGGLDHTYSTLLMAILLAEGYPADVCLWMGVFFEGLSVHPSTEVREGNHVCSFFSLDGQREVFKV